MRNYATLVIGNMDHPEVEVENDDEGVPVMTLRFSETVSLTGNEADVRRWVEELAVKTATT